MKFKRLPVLTTDKKEMLSEFSRQNLKQQNELRNQTKINQIVEEQSFNRLNSLQQQTKKYAKLIEAQLRKNQDLKTIIKGTEKNIDSQKKKLSQFVESSSSDTQSLQYFQKRKYRIENDIEQLILKLNESMAMIKGLKEEVNAARSERVIYSGIFKNLQKEIRWQEQQFKKLIIQHVQIKQEKEMAFNYFKNEELKANKGSEITLTRQSEQPFSLNNRIDLQPAEKKEQIIEKQEQKRKEKRHTKIHNLNEFENSSIIFEKIKSQLGVDVSELIQTRTQIDHENEEIFLKVNSLNDQIQKLQKELVVLNEQIVNTTKNMEPQLPDEKNMHEIAQQNLQKQINQLQDNIKKQQQVKTELLNALRPIGQILNMSKAQLAVQNKDQRQMSSMVSQIERRIINLMISQKSQKSDQTVINFLQKEIEKEKMIVGISELLDRNDKVKQTDKILSRNQFINTSFSEIQKLQLGKKVLKKSKKG